MNRKSFLGILAVVPFAKQIGLFEDFNNLVNKSNNKRSKLTMSKFELMPLPYSYDALEPFIDAKTMEIHYSKHHQAYVNNLNNLVAGTDLEGKSLEELFAKASKIPVGVKNNAGGVWNHNFFWKVLKKNNGAGPSGALAGAINSQFGSFDEFKKQLTTAATTRFGSGWAWLIASNGKLIITSTPNQDNTIMDNAEVKGTPILTIDVWEHAYYLKYQNRRPEYIENWWNVVNWDAVANLFASAK
jgi:Fe-Mn family superoxide dismutase